MHVHRIDAADALVIRSVILKGSGIPAAFFFLYAITIPACSSESSASGVADTELVARVLADVAEVHPDRLIFPSSVVPRSLRERIAKYEAAIASGKSPSEVEKVILTGSRGRDAVDETGAIREEAANPYGYIRRALSLRDEGDKTIIETEQASLEDAFEEIHAGGEEIEVGAPTSPNGLSPLATTPVKKSIPIIRMRDSDIVRHGPNFLRIAEGDLVVDVLSDIGMEMSGWRLEHSHAFFKISLNSKLVLEAGAEASVDLAGKHIIAEKTWPLGFVGPVPTSFSLQLSTVCEGAASAGASVKFGMNAEFVQTAAVVYDRQKGVQSTAPSPDFITEAIEPSHGPYLKADLKCSLRPEMRVLFFDVTGPAIIPAAYTRFEASAPPFRAKLVGGVSGSLGYNLRIFRWELGSYETELFSFEKELWRHGPEEAEP